MQTGRMSGIRRSRPSSCCSLMCWNLMSLRASCYIPPVIISRICFAVIIPYQFILCNRDNFCDFRICFISYIPNFTERSPVLSVLLAALSFALFRFRLPEAQVNTGVRIVYILSCLAGGILAGRAMKTRRFFWGLLIGALYFLLLLLMSYLQAGKLASAPQSILGILMLCLGSGMAGGMLS